MALAISSLPVPVSPTIKTGVSGLPAVSGTVALLGSGGSTGTGGGGGGGGGGRFDLDVPAFLRRKGGDGGGGEP